MKSSSLDIRDSQFRCYRIASSSRIAPYGEPHFPIEDGRLALGRWQAIFFCEFDGPRQRRVRVKILPDPAE